MTDQPQTFTTSTSGNVVSLRNAFPKDASVNRIGFAAVQTFDMSSLQLRSHPFLRSLAPARRQYSLRTGNAAFNSFARYSLSRRYTSNFSGPSLPGQIGPLNSEENGNSEGRKESPSKDGEKVYKWSQTLFKMFESAATTFASIVVLG